MNKFKLAQIAADYAADRHLEALEQLQQDKFIKVEPVNLISFLRWCIRTTKEKETFYSSIKRSIETFNPYFVKVANQKGTTLKIYTFDNFNSFWVQKEHLNTKTKRLIKKVNINIIK